MNQRVNYSNARMKIKSLFKNEELLFPRKVTESVLNFLAKIHLYEEEGKKIIPEIIFGRGLINDLFAKMFQCDLLVISKTKIGDTNLDKVLKPIVPFCDNGWRLFVNIEKDFIYSGIMRSFTGPTSVSLFDNLLTPGNLDGVDFRYILIDIISKYEIKMYTSSGKSLEIDYRFVSKGKDRDKILINLIDDILSGAQLDAENVTKQKNAFTKLFSLCPKRIHGSICLIVKEDCDLPLRDILEDGIVLSEPIDLVSALDELLSTPDISSLYEKYYALSGLLLTMMNTDGITILDNSGKIRGYNFFIKASASTAKIVGGARKRAAHSLKQSNNSNFIGVYFQSQDGDISYERMCCNE